MMNNINNLIAIILHELDHPITNIRFTIQFYQRLLQKEMDEGPHKQTVFQVFQSILEETQRMGNLIDRLAPFDITKNVIEKFDLISHINKTIHTQQTCLTKWHIKTQVSPQNPIYLTGDSVIFDQLISNLLLNAIDAIKEKKQQNPRKITINLADNKNEIKITFTDTGIGIPVERQGKIFDPFFTTKSPGKGEGLGLFIVWNILKMQGGKIKLDPNYKNGTRFLIFIPKTNQTTNKDR